jgi:hypothetical protein
MHSKNIFSIRGTAYLISGLIITLLLSACGNSEDADKVKAALEINQLDISAIELSSAKIIMEELESLKITAKAVIGDDISGSLDISNKVQWSSSNNDIATISSSGQLTGKSVGFVTVTAKLADLLGTIDIQLSDASLETIDIINSPSPVSVCRSGYELKANGNYDDATVRDISASVTWTSDDDSRLSIDETGVFATYKNGASIVTASKNNITGNTTITIDNDLSAVQIASNSSSVYIGKTLTFTATGTYDDNSTADITNTVTWSSDDSDTLTISNTTLTKGIATGISEGSTNISASCLSSPEEVSNVITITVANEPVINNIAIEEDKSILEFKIIDSPEQLTANLKRSDGTYSTDVSDNEFTDWSVSETISGQPVTISDTGEITFSAVGTTKIKVRYFDKDNNLGPFDDYIEVEIVAN